MGLATLVSIKWFVIFSCILVLLSFLLFCSSAIALRKNNWGIQRKSFLQCRFSFALHQYYKSKNLLKFSIVMFDVSLFMAISKNYWVRCLGIVSCNMWIICFFYAYLLAFCDYMTYLGIYPTQNMGLVLDDPLMGSRPKPNCRVCGIFCL